MSLADRRDAVLWLIGGTGTGLLLHRWAAAFAKFWRERPVVVRNDDGYLEVRRDISRERRLH